ncbi:MAG: aminopeptidase [Pseudomonadota bacterium]|nr:aminopeptidase [Pseudomonadota bacterium]
MRPAARLTGLLALCQLLAGCGSTGYYWQALGGHLDLMRQRRPIDAVVADAATPADLRAILRQVQDMRRFAVDALALPDNGSYRSYVALDRPYVIWNVFAAPPLSTTPREWCFPIAGCVAYRGYFRRADADALAARLREDGDDSYVGGVPAYSTLGWMDDPVLSTYVRWPQPELARLLFHELSHQVAYAAGDTAFNEAFATAVEEEGVARWIAAQGRIDLQDRWQQSQQRRAGFLQLVLGVQQDLTALYASAASDADKRAGKLERLARMRQDYQARKAEWGGFAGYDHWFDEGVNNAQLASVAVYTALVPAFRVLLHEQDGDLPRFYAQVRRLAAASADARHAALQAALSRQPASAPAPGPTAASAAATPPAAAPAH